MTFCILAAGKGTRTNSVSKIHKALLPINNKAVISHIIEKAPEGAEIVIAIGHQKDLIKEYCLASHPFRKFRFVEVDNYDGPGSGPGYSLSKCKEYLQQPFYLVCSDCLVEEPYPDLSINWLGVHPVTNSENWSTAKVEHGVVTEFKNKSPNGFNLAWIGVAGIKDYKVFWEEIKQGGDKEFEVVSAFYNPKKYEEMRAKVFTWHDTGTVKNYQKTKEDVDDQKPLGMEKTIDEITYKCDQQCVKIFKDSEVCKGRLKRSAVINKVVPGLSYAGNNVYSYNWIAGKTLYEAASVEKLQKLIEWCSETIWTPVKIQDDFQVTCAKFYKDKSEQRLQKYFEKYGEDEKRTVINGLKCPTIKELFAKINWQTLTSHNNPVKFHGDLQPENIIVADDDQFYLIDWRDSFGGRTDCGDIFYDFAKLNGGLSMSYHNIKKNKFNFEQKGKEVTYDFEVSEELSRMKYWFENWVLKNNYPLYKVRVLTALVYLNMSPLHVEPFDKLLFNHAKYLLTTLL